MNLTKQDAIFKHRILWCHIGALFEKMNDDSLYLYGLKTAYKNKCLNDSMFMLAIKHMAFTKVFLNLYSKVSQLHNCCFLCTYSNQEYKKYCKYSYMQYIEDVCSAFCPFQNVDTDAAIKPYCLNGVYKKLIQSVQKYDWKEASKIAYEIAFLKEVVK